MLARSGARRIGTAARLGQTHCLQLVTFGALDALKDSAKRERKGGERDETETKDAVFDALSDIIENYEAVAELIRADGSLCSIIAAAEATDSVLRLRKLLCEGFTDGDQETRERQT
jgi:hypothetical protein